MEKDFTYMTGYSGHYNSRAAAITDVLNGLEADQNLRGLTVNVIDVNVTQEGKGPGGYGSATSWQIDVVYYTCEIKV